MDLFARTKAEFRHGQAEFLSRQLTTCSLYIELASKVYEEGDTTFAGRATSDAETGYGTALRFLSDPQCAKHLTIKAVQDFRKQLEVLRTTLDRMRRLQKCS